jgi:hypothetical protein
LNKMCVDFAAKNLGKKSWVLGPVKAHPSTDKTSSTFPSTRIQAFRGAPQPSGPRLARPTNPRLSDRVAGGHLEGYPKFRFAIKRGGLVLVPCATADTSYNSTGHGYLVTTHSQAHRRTAKNRPTGRENLRLDDLDRLWPHPDSPDSPDATDSVGPPQSV